MASALSDASGSTRHTHDEAAHRRDANRAVAVSAAGLAVTGLAELAVALLTGSVALLGDAFHNLSDVSTSAVVFAGFRLSRRPATRSFPHGFERAEDLAGLGVALVVWASAVLAGYESYRKLAGHGSTRDVWAGMAGAVLGIIGNQVVAMYKRRTARRISSVTMMADARHSWLDALSSLGALAGLALVAAGYRWGDPVAGLAVTLFICHVGYELTKQLAVHLMDGVEPGDLQAAERAASSVPGVLGAAATGRWMGRTLALEIELRVDSGLPVARADQIGMLAEDAVFASVPAARKVHVHAHGGTSAE